MADPKAPADDDETGRLMKRPADDDGLSLLRLHVEAVRTQFRPLIFWDGDAT